MELFCIRIEAKRLATWSCSGDSTGLKVKWCSHPSADELSVKLRIFMSLGVEGMSSTNNVMAIVTVAAINSSKFMDSLPWSSVGISHLHAMPSAENPPIPNGEASEIQMVDGRPFVTWLILKPRLGAWDKNCFQRISSSCSHCVIDVCLCFFFVGTGVSIVSIVRGELRN